MSVALPTYATASLSSAERDSIPCRATVEKINSLSRILFAVSFVILRTFYFPYVALMQACRRIGGRVVIRVADLWTDCLILPNHYLIILQVLPDLWTVSRGAPAGEAIAALAGAVLATGFTCLQLYWSYLLVKQVHGVMRAGGFG